MTDFGTETVEQKQRRRRWLTLAEFVAVAGVIVAALGLWQNWSDKREERQEKVATQADEARVALTATAADGGRTLRLADARHELSDASVTFPSALGIAPQRPPGDPVIEADWFADALLRLTDGGADDRTGRLPVLIAVSYVDGDATRTASGIYDVIWRTHGRFGRGRALELTGLRLKRRGGDRAALDAAWAREKP